MPTEARKTFQHGFVLDEQELRRIVDTADGQVRKVFRDDPRIRLDAKFLNGTVTRCSSVEELLALENAGPKQIVRLEISVDDGNDAKTLQGTEIQVRFVNLAEEQDETRAITYSVKGSERDWVLVTASELEDRVAKVKRVSMHQLFKKNFVSSFITGVFFLGAMYFFTRRMASMPEPTLVRDAINSGQHLDAAQAVVLLEEDVVMRGHANPFSTVLPWFVAIPITATFLISGIRKGLNYLHPAHVFYWGDYSKVYERRITIRNYIYGGILVALVIGVIANIIVIKLHIK
jgi:hypothetical protein